MNGHGFVKRMARRCRGRRDLPRGGGGRRQNVTVWPEKLTENLVVPNFGVQSAGLRVAAREIGCTSRINASRATPTYIYTQGWKILQSEDILGIIDFRN